MSPNPINGLTGLASGGRAPGSALPRKRKARNPVKPGSVNRPGVRPTSPVSPRSPHKPLGLPPGFTHGIR